MPQDESPWPEAGLQGISVDEKGIASFYGWQFWQKHCGRRKRISFWSPSVPENRQAHLSHDGDAVHPLSGAAGRPAGWNHLRTQHWHLLLAACGSGWRSHGGLCEWTLTPRSPSPGSIPVAVATLFESPSTWPWWLGRSWMLTNPSFSDKAALWKLSMGPGSSPSMSTPEVSPWASSHLVVDSPPVSFQISDHPAQQQRLSGKLSCASFQVE